MGIVMNDVVCPEALKMEINRGSVRGKTTQSTFIPVLKGIISSRR